MQIVAMTRLSYPTVRVVVDLYETGGWSAIRPALRGRNRGDETALVNTDVRGTSYAPAGKIPVTRAIGGTRQKLSMIATVTNQGKARWMIIDEAFNADKLIEFLQASVRDAGKKVFLILDNLRVHHSKLVKAWVGQRQDQIELFYLPSYKPATQP